MVLTWLSLRRLDCWDENETNKVKSSSTISNFWLGNAGCLLWLVHQENIKSIESIKKNMILIFLFATNFRSGGKIITIHTIHSAYYTSCFCCFSQKLSYCTLTDPKQPLVNTEIINYSPCGKEGIEREYQMTPILLL